jgi:hypothetical protein
MAENTQTLPRVERSTSGIKNSLFQMLDGLEGGTLEADKASAMCRVITTILSVSRLEVSIYRALGESKAATGVLSLPAATLDGQSKQAETH